MQCAIRAGLGYHAFGVPELAMKTPDGNSSVISPYSTFLALVVHPRFCSEEPANNGGSRVDRQVRLLRSSGLPIGKKPEIIRSWMAHHEGMSLLAVRDLPLQESIQKYFHAEPYVQATELSAPRTVPHVISIDAEESAVPAALLTETAV